MRSSNLFNKIVAYSALSAGTYLVGKALIRMFNTFSLNNKVVLITGGSRGLGFILARKMAEEGAKIVICGRSEDSLNNALYKLKKISTKNHLAIPCDISDKRQIKDMISQISKEIGTVDILVNNAGIVQIGPMETMDEEDYKQALDVYFWGPFHLMNEVLPDMKRKKMGRIVNIVSIGGIISIPHLLPYNVSKHAFSGLSKGVTGELNQFGIKITTVYPGLMRTGSPKHADVKGQHQKEYAWFKISDSLPLISMNAERAAVKIIDAMKKGDKSLTLTFPAKLVTTMQAVAPEFTLSIFDVINYLLPEKPEGKDVKQTKKGHESESIISQSSVTKKTEEAAEKNLQNQ